ncbi:ABC transporter permease [soil metagenome]
MATASIIHARYDGEELARIERELDRERRGAAWQRIRTSGSLVTGLAILLVLLTLGLMTAVFSTGDVNAVDPANRLLPPNSAGHLFGTDDFGRDLLLRVAAGARTSLMLGATVGFLSVGLGLFVGMLAGYFRALDQFIMRVCDGIMAIPAILLALALVAALGANTLSLVASLVVVFTPRVARIARSRVLSIREETFIEACRSQGAGHARILLMHVAPNVVPLLIVQFTLLFADTVLTEAALSFLGAGVSAPAASLGNIIYDGKQVIFNTPWMVVIPSTVLVLVVLSLNLIGDGVEAFLNPQARIRLPRDRWWRRRPQAEGNVA